MDAKSVPATDTPRARKPRLTVEEAWPYARQLLVLADDADKRDILQGKRNADEAETLTDRAARLRRDADDCETRAEGLTDLRIGVRERLLSRAQEMIK